MIEKLLLVIGVSLAGSVHCAGMCGAFVAFAVGGDTEDTSPRWLLNLNYHLGRLVTYTLLGVGCGALGAVMDFGGGLVGVQRAAAIVTGVMIVALGLVGLARSLGWRIGSTRTPAFVQKAVNFAMRASMRLRPPHRALTIGLLTTLLPCGWLWAFAAAAAGTADPIYGGLVMAAFWLGTVPILAGMGLTVSSMFRWAKPKLAVAMSIIIVAFGLLTIFNRDHMAGVVKAAPIELTDEALSATPSCCQPDGN